MRFNRGVQRIPVSPKRRKAPFEFLDLNIQMCSCCLLHRNDLQYPGFLFQGRHVINAKAMLERGPGLSLPSKDRTDKASNVIHTVSMYWLSRCAMLM